MLFAAKEISIFEIHRLYLQRKYDKALHLCELLLVNQPESHSALNIIANIYFIKGNFAKGTEYIYKLKNIFMKNQEYDKAVGIMQRLTAVDPENPKFLSDIAEIYELSGRHGLAIRKQLEIAEIHRHAGRFTVTSEIYKNLSEKYNSPKLLTNIFNNLILLGNMTLLGEVAAKRILFSDHFSDYEKDDVFLLCAESNCPPKYIIKYLPNFLINGSDRLAFAEKMILVYFSENRDHELFTELVRIVGLNELRQIHYMISDEAPDNIPTLEELTAEPEIIDEPAVIDEPVAIDEPEIIDEVELYEAPAETFIESHITDDTEEITMEHLELDTFETDDGNPAVDTSVTGLETFEADDTPAETENIAGLERYDFDMELPSPETQEPAETIQPEPAEVSDPFDSFTEQKADSADVFAGFDEISESAPSQSPLDDFFSEETYAAEQEDIFAHADKTETETIDMSDIIISKKDDTDIFADLEEAPAEQEKVVQKLDLSDMVMEQKKTDIFADLEEEEEPEVTVEPPKPKPKIILDAAELLKKKKEGNSDGDIFDMEV
jgi:tetratricopeptide (TPR) repeat protein